MSISEREENDCGGGTEPDGAECTTLPNGGADGVKVPRINMRSTGLFADNVVE